MNKKVLILTHNHGRDVFFDKLLEQELSNRGHKTWLRGYLKGDKAAVCAIKPDIVVLPEIRCEYTRDFAYQLKQWGVQVVVRLCEVAITEDSIPKISDAYRRAIFGNWPANHCADLVLAWGAKTKKLLSQYGSFSSEKIHAIGGIAFDQYIGKPLPPIVERNDDKERIMFCTGFAYADRNQEYSMPEALPEDPLHSELVQTDRASRSKYIDMVKWFISKHSDKYHIEVKPHAGEKELVYKKMLGDSVVLNAMTGFQALYNAEYFVHAGSTMAFEAHLVNRPAFSFSNVCQDVVVSKISPSFDTKEKLFKAIEKTPSGKSNANPEIISRLAEYYGPVDGNAYIRAADLIDSMPRNTTSVPDVYPKASSPRYLTGDVIIDMMQWSCEGCHNAYFVKSRHREMVKCPYCGIANVRVQIGA
jgi:surface carbohydrate biosynthesis protein